MIGGFRSVLCVSLFQGSLLVIVIIIDGSEKCNCESGFELKSSHVCEKHSKVSVQSVRLLDQAGYFWFSYKTIFLSSVNQLSLSHLILVERQ